MCFSFKAMGATEAQAIERLRQAFGDLALCKIQQSTAAIIGCGVLGRKVASQLAEKGYSLWLIDPQRVEKVNLVQGFMREDEGTHKVIATARTLSRSALLPIEIQACSLTFAKAACAHPELLKADVAVVVTDNVASRLEVSRTYYKIAPVVSAGIAPDLTHGFVYAQQPGGTCLACAFPHFDLRDAEPCGVGMAGDIAEAIASLASYAVDSLIMPERRPRFWNSRTLSLAGDFDYKQATVAPRPGCPVCGSLVGL